MYHLLSILLIIICGQAYGVSEGEISAIKSHADVKRMLAKDNINPVSLNWAEIEHRCKMIAKRYDPSSFNQCNYRSARDMGSFNKDRKICQDESKITFSESNVGKTVQIHSDRREHTEKYDDKVVSTHVYSEADLKVDRKKAHHQCMKSFGWHDPNNWESGKH